MDQDKFTYTIADKNYIQRPLVLGQINQLMAVLKGLQFPKDPDVAVLISLLGNRLHTALAIVLHETDKVRGKNRQEIGRYLMERDIKELAAELEFCAEAELIMQVIEDFFDCNPIQSLLERFGKLGKSLGDRISLMKTGLTKSVSSSPMETLPDGTTFSGGTPSQNADHI
jgi:hypothetical protein